MKYSELICIYFDIVVEYFNDFNDGLIDKRDLLLFLLLLPLQMPKAKKSVTEEVST